MCEIIFAKPARIIPAMPDIDIQHLQTWVGRKETVVDMIARNPAASLAATLDRETLPATGDPLPPLWHWLYFTPLAPQSQIGIDGHPRLGGFMPPVPLPRRMWAGGRLRFPGTILLGEEVSKETEIAKVSLKSGQQGALVFVTLIHRLSTKRGLAIEEEQDIVYREPSPAGTAPATTGPAGELKPALWRDAVATDPVLLFRYSALTFNAHRIHYDLPYAQIEEGYPGLVVHGPLTATLLAERLLAHVKGRLTEFSFRGQKPLFVGNPLALCGRAETDVYALWAEGPDGEAMSATARVEPAA